uniref:Ovule protein n=1 Tax=Steinernema glaseri TaxID=37863 RepID=A0A1I7ZTL7_9BILA
MDGNMSLTCFVKTGRHSGMLMRGIIQSSFRLRVHHRYAKVNVYYVSTCMDDILKVDNIYMVLRVVSMV